MPHNRIVSFYKYQVSYTTQNKHLIANFVVPMYLIFIIIQQRLYTANGKKKKL